MEHIEYLKGENKTKNSIIKSLCNQYNYTYNNNNIIDNRNHNNINFIIPVNKNQICSTYPMFIFQASFWRTLCPFSSLHH